MKEFFMILLVSTISSCASNKDNEKAPIKQTTVAAVVDLTDATTLKLWPKVKPIIALYKCSEFPDQACKFSITAISDLKTNPVYQPLLPNALETEKLNRNDDMQWRSKEIQKYYDDVTKILSRFYQANDTSKNRSHSEVWETIARSLENLAKEPDGEKYLLVFSDLQEMSLTGNAYKSFKTMTIEAIAKKLTDAHPIPKNINGIIVAVVYQPMGREDDLRFNQMYMVYKAMLEAEGVLVSNQATVDQF